MLLECSLVCQISDLLCFLHHTPTLAGKLPVIFQVLVLGQCPQNWQLIGLPFRITKTWTLLICSSRCQILKMMLLSCEREGWTLGVSGDIAAILGTGF